VEITLAINVSATVDITEATAVTFSVFSHSLSRAAMSGVVFEDGRGDTICSDLLLIGKEHGVILHAHTPDIRYMILLS